MSQGFWSGGDFGPGGPKSPGSGQIKRSGPGILVRALKSLSSFVYQRSCMFQHAACTPGLPDEVKWRQRSTVRCSPDPGVWRTPLKPYTFYYIAKCNSQKVSFTRDGESVRRREWCRIYSFEFAHWISSHTLPARKLIGLPSVNRLPGPISLEILVSRTIDISMPWQKSRTNYRVSLQGRARPEAEYAISAEA